MVYRFSRWKERLQDANSVGEVKRILGEYIDAIPTAFRAGMPADCQSALNADDIAGSAVVLIREELNYSGQPDIAEMLHEVAHTFVAAQNRIVSIRSRGEPLTQTQP